MSPRHLFVLGLLGALAAGCSAGGSGPRGGSGAGGTTTGSGAGGSTGGGAGANGGGAGTTGEAGMNGGGAAGTTEGNAGTNGGGAGMAAGATGTTGVGGTTGGAGAGAAGATGGGAGAMGMAGMMSGRASGPSVGCMKDVPNEPLGMCVMHNIDITGMAQAYVAGYTHRTYGTTIPKGYDPTKPLPVVIYGPGCGGEACEGGPFTGRTDIFLVQAMKAPDVYSGKVPPVPPAAAPGCFQTGVISTVDSPENNYFDQVLAEVESKYCIDTAKVFVAGSSSGAWFANYLACSRGNVVRGAAADSGGIPVDRPPCTGGASVIEYPGDSATKSDSMGRPIGAAVARDLFIKTNGCMMTSGQMKLGNATCDVYGGCTSPVAWCNVGGGHQSGLGSMNATSWALWSTLQ
jgi:hypothetical protein